MSRLAQSTAAQAMEQAEIIQRLSFLDTERRKDKELVTTLLERLETQTSKLGAQERQIQELERLLASTRAELVKFDQVKRSMEQLRQELTLLIEANEEKRVKVDRESARLRQVEQETVTRQLAELRKELKPIPRYDEEIESLRAEKSRLHGALTSLQHGVAELDKRNEDRMQTVIYLEEQRRQDNRRITDVEGEAVSLHKKLDELSDKLPLLEQAIQTKNKDIDKAADLLAQQSQLIENQRVAEFRWERQIVEWTKLVEEIKQQANDMSTQTVRLHEQHDQIRRALTDLGTFRERLERRQNEMAEMQRLAEDRQKRILEEWQAEREKAWKHFQVDNQERWRDNTRINDRRDTRAKAIEEHANMLAAQTAALWEVQEAWAQSIMTGPREWLATWDGLVKQRPSMPEPLKPAPLTPTETPKIRPLPSAQTNKEEQGA